MTEEDDCYLYIAPGIIKCHDFVFLLTGEEVELCRFQLKEGTRLRLDYKNFYVLHAGEGTAFCLLS